MKLVIVESPTKARTISRFLGKDYLIKFSMGHIMDLPKSKLGVDVDNGFNPQYEVVEDKKKTIAELKKAAKTSDSIILATDPDREGEAIASHVKDMLGKTQKYQRVVFHEITKEAVDEAFKNPRVIDTNLVDAQTARRVLDRLVGYKLSPLLWKKVRRGLSAGRVQSVALRLIVEREREIENFKKEPYFTITAFVKKENIDNILFELIEVDGEKIDVQRTLKLYDGEYKYKKTIIGTEQDAQNILDDLKSKSLVVSDVLEKEVHRSPQPPYTTSTLQQDGARRLGLNGRRTMSLAQKLYEEGFITYHRTDSVVISNAALFSTRNYIEKEFGKRYLPEKPKFYSTKQKLAQEAHEAIRPTKVSNQTSAISNQLGEQYGKLYELIWRRAVASQMADAITESTTVIADAKRERNFRFKANGSVLIFDGFLKVNPSGLGDNKLPEFKKEEVLHPAKIEKTFHETLPPPRYNDASLIKSLEEAGIGRPSTYASIVATIESRAYIERDQGRFVPTVVGVAVNDFLVANFSTIDDIPFTAEMEDELDNIANGEKEWEPMIKNFYSPFEKKLGEVEGAARVKIAVEETDEICPNCGSKLVIRTGRFGKFLSCSKFPECKFTKPFVEKTNLKCPKDGGDVIVKKTRKGRKFFGCSNYPKCDFAAWKLEDISGNSKIKNQNSKAQIKS
ncbi:MAG: DNA topoisomerase I [Candidatus Levybacteria bacterium RIFCSPHIGHO2_01_FULL_38_26]|nr:MAG: DNA topoisomerase I [Candidatus Levybacteria bacterium RIFCSPHIGHO2_01_FULL_38_26]